MKSRKTIPIPPAFRLAAVVIAAIAWLPVAAAETPPLCRGADENSSPALSTPIPEGFAAKVDSLWALVEALQGELGVALSFIEARDAEPIVPPTDARTLEGVLRAIIDQHPSYRCEVLAGRMVLRSKDLLFDQTVSKVDIVDQYRIPGMKAYLELLHAADPGFADWEPPLITTAGFDPFSNPIFAGKVTLSPRAPVVLHLVQLLGSDRDVYFEIPAPHPDLPWRSIYFGMVRPPWERARRGASHNPPTPPATTP